MHVVYLLVGFIKLCECCDHDVLLVCIVSIDNWLDLTNSGYILYNGFNNADIMDMYFMGLCL